MLLLNSFDLEGKHDIKKDKKGLTRELRDKKDAKASAMTVKVSSSRMLHSFCSFTTLS